MFITEEYQKFIDTRIFKICKYLRFVSDNLGKDRPELTFFVVDIYSGN